MTEKEVWESWINDLDDPTETLMLERGPACEDCIVSHDLSTEWARCVGVHEGETVECQWCST